MEESILTTIKKMLGLEKDYDAFDVEIISHINSEFSVLFQLGVGPVDKAYHITGYDETWNDFYTGREDIDAVQQFIFCKTKIMFDSNNLSSAVIDAYAGRAKELEWRLLVACDPVEGTNNG